MYGIDSVQTATRNEVVRTTMAGNALEISPFFFSTIKPVFECRDNHTQLGGYGRLLL
jgi:hypothetical protein